MINEELRATGKTTREIDAYIQEIFNNPNVRVRTTNAYNQDNQIVHDKALKRLQSEHQGEFRSGRDGQYPWIAYIKLGLK